MNLLDQLQPSKRCQVCGENKPLTAFAIGTTATGKSIYSQICETCRSRQFEEEERESGGKKTRLNLDSNARQSIIDQQSDDQEAFHDEKENYIDELDDAARERDKNEKALDKEKRRRGFLNDFIGREEKWLKTHTKAEATWAERQRQLPSTEFGFDADVHDPMRQKPNAAHHFLYVTHPDRMDVKFLLEYILSGDYAQRYTGLIGPSKRGFIHQPGIALDSSALANGKFFRLSEVRFSHPGRLDVTKIKNAKGSIHIKVSPQRAQASATKAYSASPATKISAIATNTTPTQVKAQGKPVSSKLATTVHPAAMIAAVPLTRTATRVTSTPSKAGPTRSRMAFMSNARNVSSSNTAGQTRTKTSQRQFSSNPSSFTTAGTRATQLHNQSKPIGCEFVKSSRHSAGTFQQKPQRSASESAKKGASRIMNAFKSSWGGKR